MVTEVLSKGLVRLIKLDDPAGIQSMGTLLDKVFPVGPTGSYYDDFPVWKMIHGEHIVRLGVGDDAGNLKSCAAGRICHLRTPLGGLIPIGLIGAVATDPMARNQGLASQVVSAVSDALAQKGAAAIFLWGSEHTMYQRLGFELCGEQSRIALNHLGLETAIETPLRSVHKGWNPQIFDLQKRRRHGLALFAHDHAWMSEHGNTEWWTLQAQGRVTAYLGYGRGMDMQGIVHEWGGDAGDLQLLLKKFHLERPHSELLCNDALLRESGFTAKPTDLEYLCLGKVIQPSLFLSAYGRGHQARCQFVDDHWQITLQFHPTHTLTQREMSKFFFGPEQYSEFARLQDSWEPLPLWFWGLDAA